MSLINRLLLSALFALGAIRVSQQSKVTLCQFPTEEMRDKINQMTDLPNVRYCQAQTDKCLNLTGNGKVEGLKHYSILCFRDSPHSGPFLQLHYEKLFVTYDVYGNDEQHERWESQEPLSLRIYLDQESTCQMRGAREVEFYVVEEEIDDCKGCKLFKEETWKCVKNGLMREFNKKYIQAITAVMKASVKKIQIC